MSKINTKAMWKSDGGYTDIDGFHVDGSGSSSTAATIGIRTTGGNSSIVNSWVHNIGVYAICNDIGGAALLADQGRGASFDNYDFIGNIVHNIGIHCGWFHGIYHSSTGTIKNNVVFASGQGINLGHEFHNNIIYDNGGGIQGPIVAEDGDNSFQNNLGTFASASSVDFAGAERPFGAGVDIGAYEYDASVPASSSASVLPDLPVFSFSFKSLLFPYQSIGGSSSVQRGGGLIDLSEYGNCELGISQAPASRCSASVNFRPMMTEDIRSEVLSLSSTASSPPAPVITAPTNDTSVAVRSNVSIEASMPDGIAIKTVKFYVSDRLKCTVSAAPYQCVWKVP